MGEAGAGTESIIPIVENALELRPESHEARLRLAALYRRAGKFGRVLTNIASMGPVVPEEACQTYSLLAYAYSGLGEMEKAKEAAGLARPFARTPSEVSNLERLTHALAQKEQPASQPVLPRAVEPAQPARAGANERPPEPQVPETPANPQVKGLLRQFDCLNNQARLIIESDGKKIALLIVDPTRIAISGKKEGTIAFNCGPQPGQPVRVEYLPVPDAKLGTAGQVLIVEFL